MLLNVLERLVVAGPPGTYCYRITADTKASGGTVHANLGRLEAAGYLRRRFEANPNPGGRPRRVCVLTPTGDTYARTILAARRPGVQLPAAA